MHKKAILLSALFIALFLTGCGNEVEPTSVPTDTSIPATPTLPPTATNPPNTSTPESKPTTELESQQTASASSTITQSESYPAPTVEAAYPSPAQVAALITSTNLVTLSTDSAAYPAPAATATDVSSRIPVIPFVLERPVKPGATVISGTGPANVPILIVDVGFMGDILGQGTISKDGKFAIEVKPLVENSYIGVAVDELEGTDLTHEDFRARGFNGPGAEQIPQVGYIFDTLIVRP